MACTRIWTDLRGRHRRTHRAQDQQESPQQKKAEQLRRCGHAPQGGTHPTESPIVGPSQQKVRPPLPSSTFTPGSGAVGVHRLVLPPLPSSTLQSRRSDRPVPRPSGTGQPESILGAAVANRLVRRPLSSATLKSKIGAAVLELATSTSAGADLSFPCGPHTTETRESKFVEFVDAIGSMPCPTRPLYALRLHRTVLPLKVSVESMLLTGKVLENRTSPQITSISCQVLGPCVFTSTFRAFILRSTDFLLGPRGARSVSRRPPHHDELCSDPGPGLRGVVAHRYEEEAHRYEAHLRPPCFREPRLGPLHLAKTICDVAKPLGGGCCLAMCSTWSETAPDGS